MKLFNVEKPTESIVYFTNHGLKLPPERKREFIDRVQAFFSEQAFTDQHLDLYINSERFSRHDLPSLLKTMKEIKYPKALFAYMQLVANISKVTGQYLSPQVNEGHLHQIIVLAPDSNHPPIFWGWIREEYVENSLLNSRLNASKIELTCEEIKPSVLFALQRFECFVSDMQQADVSFESLRDLLVFAIEWKILPLARKAGLIMRQMSCKPEELFEKLIDGLSAEEKMKLEEAGITLRSFSDSPSEPIVLIGHTSEAKGSVWFKKSDPFGSIAKFTGECCTLLPEEQQVFFSSLKYFFTKRAYYQRPIAIPEELKTRFAKIDLPFLLATMQHVTTDERARLISNIQSVTRCYFVAIRESDRLMSLRSTYGDAKTPENTHFGWLLTKSAPSLLLSSETGYLEEKPLDWRLPSPSDHAAVTTLDRRVSGSLEEVFDLFLKTVDQSIEPWKENICRSFRAFYQGTLQERKDLSTRLAGYLDRDEICALLVKYEMTELVPDFAMLNEEQLALVLVFNIKNAKDQSDLSDPIRLALGEYSHRSEIISRYLKHAASKEEKRSIQRYCMECPDLHAVVVQRLKDGNSEERASFHDYCLSHAEVMYVPMIDYLKQCDERERGYFQDYAVVYLMHQIEDSNEHHFLQALLIDLTIETFSDESSKHEYFDKQAKSFSVEMTKVEHAFNTLSKNRVEELFELVGYRDLRAVIMQGLLYLFPSILREQKKILLQKFSGLDLSQEVTYTIRSSHFGNIREDESKRELRSLFEELADLVIAGEGDSLAKCRGFAKTNPLDPTTILEIEQLLKNSEFNQWVRQNAPILADFGKVFARIYQPQTAKLRLLVNARFDGVVLQFLNMTFDAMLDNLLREDMLPYKSFKLRMTGKSYFDARDNITSVRESVFRANYLGEGEARIIQKFLNEEDIKTFFAVSGYQKEYAFLVKSMAHISRSVELGDRFLRDIVGDRLDHASKSACFIRDLFKEFYILISTGRPWIIIGHERQTHLKEQYPLEEDDLAQLPLLLQSEREKIDQWLKVNAPKLKISSFEDGVMKYNFKLKLVLDHFHVRQLANRDCSPTSGRFLNEALATFRENLDLYFLKKEDLERHNEIEKKMMREHYNEIQKNLRGLISKYGVSSRELLNMKKMLEKQEVVALLDKEDQKVRQFLIDEIPNHVSWFDSFLG